MGKSELQQFFERTITTQTGYKVEIIATEQVKKEIREIAKLGEMIQVVGAVRFADLYRRTAQKKSDAVAKN